MSDSSDLTAWLQEAGRRDIAAGSRTAQPTLMGSGVAAGPAQRWSNENGRQLLGFAGLVLAYLQYYFIGVAVEIYSSPALIVFVSHGPFS